MSYFAKRSPADRTFIEEIFITNRGAVCLGEELASIGGNELDPEFRRIMIKFQHCR